MFYRVSICVLIFRKIKNPIMIRNLIKRRFFHFRDEYRMIFFLKNDKKIFIFLKTRSKIKIIKKMEVK